MDKKTILSNQIGKWRVDIQDNNGTVLAQKISKSKIFLTIIEILKSKYILFSYLLLVAKTFQ